MSAVLSSFSNCPYSWSISRTFRLLVPLPSIAQSCHTVVGLDHIRSNPLPMEFERKPDQMISSLSQCRSSPGFVSTLCYDSSCDSLLSTITPMAFSESLLVEIKRSHHMIPALCPPSILSLHLQWCPALTFPTMSCPL